MVSPASILSSTTTTSNSPSSCVSPCAGSPVAKHVRTAGKLSRAAILSFTGNRDDPPCSATRLSHESQADPASALRGH
jgi:hypothetical protein